MEGYSRRESTPWLGYLFALGATIIWSGNFIVARGLYESIPPATLAFMRWFTATVALLPLALPALWRERHLIRPNLGYLLLTSFLGVTAFNTLLYIAARTTSALNLSLIATSSPVFTLLFAWFFLKEPITKGRLAGVTVAILGVLTLVTQGNLSLLIHLDFSLGDLWMLLAAVIFGAYSVLVKRKPPQIGQTAFLLSTFTLGLALLTPWAGWEVHQNGIPQFSMVLLGAILYIGFGASLTSFYLWYKAIDKVGPSRASFIYYTLPVFSGLEACLLLGESVNWVHAASGLLIFCGIVLAART
jgi:drug/metabolite transporter (DMT)-like permease